MRWRALVVLLAPDEVPGSRNDEESKENDRSVVHEFRSDGDVRRHAEEGDSKRGPT